MRKAYVVAVSSGTRQQIEAVCMDHPTARQVAQDYVKVMHADSEQQWQPQPGTRLHETLDIVHANGECAIHIIETLLVEE